MAYISFKVVAGRTLDLRQSIPPPPISSASALAIALGVHWPPPPSLSLKSILSSDIFLRIGGPFVQIPEVAPPFEEACTNPVNQALSEDLLDTSTVTYSELLPWITGAPASVTYIHAEGRLINWLRVAAQLIDPLEVLKQSAVSFYAVGVITRTPPDTIEGATALADLAVTGRNAFGKFRSQPPQDTDLLADVRGRLQTLLGAPPDQNRLNASVATALNRAYQVVWALRDPNPITRAQTRASLNPNWIAVSGEDDSPDRPVNVASAPFTHFDLSVTGPPGTAGIPLAVETRYVIALPEPSYTSDSPSFPIRQIPNTPTPSIPADHEIILFIHGMDSRAEEAADMLNSPQGPPNAAPLLQTGLQNGKKYAVIAFDLPSNGYSQMIDHTTVAPSSATNFDTHPLSSSPATYPLLDWLVEFVISFVNSLDQLVPIKNRIAAIIGGSLGGNLCLRLGERNDQSWISNIVSWSSASVWSSFNHDLVKGGALTSAQGWMEEPEAVNPGDPPRRVRFFYEAFDSSAGPGPPPQPQLWYRDSWPCKAAYIQDDRMERREIYNQIFRRWHWRVGLEQLLFSHLNTDTPNGLSRYASDQTRTFLLSGQADNFNWSNIYTATRNLGSPDAAKQHTGRFPLSSEYGSFDSQ
jgi:pimeloyl-ACP methyl ester carboxylesterase